MDTRPRKLNELRKEFESVEASLRMGARLIRLQRRELAQRGNALLEASSLSWLDQTSGTPAEQQRLLRVAGCVGRTPNALQLVESIREYERRYSQERWQRPTLADWERLVAAARPVIALAVRAEAELLKRKRDELDVAHRRQQLLRTHRSALMWRLRDNPPNGRFDKAG